MTGTSDVWIKKAESLGRELAEFYARHDEDGTFAEEGYAALKEDGLFAALVPTELGGGGASYRDICEFIRTLAKHDASTALAYSMHTHLVAATVFKYKKGQPGEALLRKVVEGTVLVSTGAGDWLESNGVMTKVDGGYRYTSKKAFASGSPMADLLITSGRYEHPTEGSLVLHFPLSLGAEGVSVSSDWDAHGMRGTGSHTVVIENAFIPEQAIALSRPRGPWHPAFLVIATAALPIITSAYVGIAERAVEIAIEQAKPRSSDVGVQFLAGELCTELFIARALWNAHVENAAELDFTPEFQRACRSTEAKTALSDSVVRVTDKAMELAGGAGFFRRLGLERLRRDARAAHYHPLQAKRQHAFSGRVALGLEPA